MTEINIQVPTIRVGPRSRVRVKPGKEGATPGLILKPGTTGLVCSATMHFGPGSGGKWTIQVIVNPAIIWEGDQHEFDDIWDAVPDDTKLTF